MIIDSPNLSASFRSRFSFISGRCFVTSIFYSSGHDKQLRTHMLDVMGFAITDGGAVPQPLLDVILECLLEKTRKMNPSAYDLARDLLKRTSSIMEQFLMLVSDFYNKDPRNEYRQKFCGDCLFVFYRQVPDFIGDASTADTRLLVLCENALLFNSIQLLSLAPLT